MGFDFVAAGLDTVTMPTNGMELAVVIIFILANVFAVFWQNRKASGARDAAKAEREESHSELAEVLEKIRHQIENSHETNFRDEFDGVIHNVDYLVAKAKTDSVEDMKFRTDVYEQLQKLTSVAVKNHPKDMK